MTDIVALFNELHAQVFNPDRIPVAVCAILIVSVFGVITGPLGGNANPFFWRAIDLLFGPLGSKLDKTERKSGDLATRGLVITVLALILGFMVGNFFASLSTHYPNFLIVDIVALSIIMSAGAGWYALFRLYKALHSKDLIKGAFYTLAATTRSNLSTADEFTITRVGIGMGAKLLDKAIVGPVLWYLIGGLPAAYLYATLAALGWRFGKEGFTKGFGAPALAMERLMGFIPNWFAGLLLGFGGLLTPTAGMTRSIISLFPAKKGHAKYEEGGAPVTAMAFALKVSLGGATQDQDGSAIPRGWAGPDAATAKLDAKHLHRGLYILVMAHLLLLGGLLVIIVLQGHGVFS